MKAVWKYLLHYYANGFYGSDNRVDAGIEEISALERTMALNI
jgi:hypothetical protein